jgi:hypothetical protein
VQYVEDEDDINNIEAWAEIIADILHWVPVEARMQVLQLAIAKHEADVTEAAGHGAFELLPTTELLNQNSPPGLRHWGAIMRLKSLIIQVLTRQIRNSHSSQDAAKLLFAEHRYGTGSGDLGDYINDLVELDRGS